jgi:hypothetical protein
MAGMRSHSTSKTPATSSIQRLGAVALTALAFVACEADDVEPGDPELLVDDGEATDEIIDNLRLAGYPEAEIEVREDGVVIVGGDAMVSLEASREMIGSVDPEEQGDGDAFRQYRSYNLVSSSIGLICINGTALTGTLSTGLDNAISNYNNLPLSFDMVRTGDAPMGCDAEIKIHLTSGAGGLSSFPEGGIPYDSVSIGSGIAGYGTAVATHVITHELGHSIGLRHSDYYNRAISCAGVVYNEGQGGVGAVQIPGTPATAVYNGSIMNACYNPGNTGVFTPSDVVALEELYGVDPNSCHENDACGWQAPGGCFCDVACAAFGDCCFDGPC